MFESRFKEIADRENGTYKLDKFSAGIFVGSTITSRLPIHVHELSFEYKSTALNLRYDLGDSNLAYFKCTINVKHIVPDMTIEAREHLARLFSFKKKNVWKIKCKDQRMEHTLNELLQSSGLTDIAKAETFEPQISGSFNHTQYQFNTKYYLGFNDKEHSIEPMIQFYKGFIDYIRSEYVGF